MEAVTVHPRVSRVHPEISEEDVLDAWENCICAVPRLDRAPSEYIALGVDAKGRLIEMISVRSQDGDWLVYHAMTPPTKKALAELGFGRRPG